MRYQKMCLGRVSTGGADAVFFEALLGKNAVTMRYGLGCNPCKNNHIVYKLPSNGRNYVFKAIFVAHRNYLITDQTTQANEIVF